MIIRSPVIAGTAVVGILLVLPDASVPAYGIKFILKLRCAGPDEGTTLAVPGAPTSARSPCACPRPKRQATPPPPAHPSSGTASRLTGAARMVASASTHRKAISQYENRQAEVPVDRPDLELLRGAIDMHAHTAPALFKRHIDDAALAEYAIEYGMRGFVLKDHDASTTGRAYYVNRMYPQVESFGAVVLNRSVGGLNPYVAEAAIHYGARVVWMPSNHSKYHAEFFNISDYPQFSRPKKQLEGEGVTVFEEDGTTLTKDARTICDVVAANDVCLATGHLSLSEIRALQDAANEAGVRRFLVTHANWSLCKLDVSVQKELIAKGATVEYVASSCVSPIFWEQQPSELAEWIKELRGENLVFGSDLGQFAGPPHPEGLRMLLAALIDVGVPYEYLKRMTTENPVRVLGLEREWTANPAAPSHPQMLAGEGGS